MTENQCDQVERWIDTADVQRLADVLVAAIMRVGQLGRHAAEALAARMPDPEPDALWEEGADWVATVLAGELAK